MNSLDASYWTKRYREQQTGWDLGSVSTPLKEYFDQLSDKSIKILIPGAGNSYEAEYLINNGFTDVTVCDLSEVPLENLKKRIVEWRPLRLIHGDFFLLQGKYDLIVEQTFFCAIDPSFRSMYFEKVQGLLKPGGKLAGLLFDDELNTDKPPFGGSREEYLSYIPKGLEIVTFESCYNSIKPRAGRELFIILKKNTNHNI